MSGIGLALPQYLIESIGLALLHFIWQGALVAALLAGVMSLLDRRAANLRYLAACGAIGLMLVLPFASAAWSFKSAGEASAIMSVSAAPGIALDAPRQESSPDRWSSFWRRESIGLDAIMPWVIWFWLVGVVICSLRLVGGWVCVRRLTRNRVRPVATEWQTKLRPLAARLMVTRPVRLIESALVQVPTAIGWLRPVILLPASALAGLTPSQLEAILAHELAHIRRHDYLINLLQRMIETLLFYHPAVWWVSRQARIEREHCCDDLAVAACGDALVYARALAQMDGLRSAPQLAVAATGGLLNSRIRRLLGVAECNGKSGTLSACAAGLAMVLTVVALISNKPTAHSASSPRDNQSESARQLSGPTSPAIKDRPAGAAQLANRASPGQEKEATPQPPRAPFFKLEGQDVESQLALLNDADFQVRDDAIGALGKLRDRRAVEPLIALLNDPNIYIRDNAINSLGLIGDPRALEPLLGALEDQNVYIRDNAITALGRLRDSRAVEPLISLLGERNVYLRDNAVAALGEIGDRRAVEPLRAALNDENWYVRETAAKSLRRILGN